MPTDDIAVLQRSLDRKQDALLRLQNKTSWSRFDYDWKRELDRDVAGLTVAIERLRVPCAARPAEAE